MHDVNKGNCGNEEICKNSLHYLLNFSLNLKLFYKIKSCNKRRQKSYQTISSRVILTPYFTYENISFWTVI